MTHPQAPWQLQVVVQSLSHVQLLVTPWTAAHQVSLSFTMSRSFLKLMSFELVMPSNHLVLCGRLLIQSSIFPSISVFFQWVSSLYQVVKVLEFQHESFQCISKIDILLDLPAVQETLKRVFSNTIVQKHQFFGIQPYLWSNSHIHT